MGTFVAKNLANGQAPATKTDVYTVPGPSPSAIVNSVLLVNTNTGATRYVNIYADFGTGSRQLSPVDLAVGPGSQVELDFSLTLESGHKLQLEADAAGEVDYVISGVQEAA